MKGISLDTILTKFSKQIQHPDNFLGINEELSDDLKSSIKDFYDFAKSEETKTIKKSLNKLIIHNFDFEQIWQQIELQNDNVIDNAVTDLSTLLVARNKLIFNSLSEELNKKEEGNAEVEQTSNNSDSDELDAQIDSDSNSSDESYEEIQDGQQSNQKNAKQKGFVVDDEFFKLNEMEDFLDEMDKPKVPKKPSQESDEDENDDDDDVSVDLFEEDSEHSEDEAKAAKFKDYFVAKEGNELKRNKNNKLLQELEELQSESEPEEKDLENQIKSTLEHRQERLKRKINDLEEQAISEKPWQLKGEITAESRPQNSLLEEIVEFDLTSRPAPIITEQTSLQLEDIIRQRIKHKTFDSVEKKSRPVETPLEYRKKRVLDQEKSKESLANIYEKEYLEQQAALQKDPMETQEEEPELHKEVKKLMKSLFSKLDALSNFHFTSTPAIPELKIVSNLPAVNIEEVAPIATSDAALLAPEEIRNKPKGDIIGKQEKTRTDKKRDRRKKKLKQKIHSKRKAKIENQVSKKLHIKA